MNTKRIKELSTQLEDARLQLDKLVEHAAPLPLAAGQTRRN